jgi:hypothetical protein
MKDYLERHRISQVSMPPTTRRRVEALWVRQVKLRCTGAARGPQSAFSVAASTP